MTLTEMFLLKPRQIIRQATYYGESFIVLEVENIDYEGDLNCLVLFDADPDFPEQPGDSWYTHINEYTAATVELIE